MDLQLCTETDAGLAYLSGIHTLEMRGCKLVTDAAGLAHLSGIHTLEMRNCKQLTDACLAHRWWGRG